MHSFSAHVTINALSIYTVIKTFLLFSTKCSFCLFFVTLSIIINTNSISNDNILLTFISPILALFPLCQQLSSVLSAYLQLLSDLIPSPQLLYKQNHLIIHRLIGLCVLSKRFRPITVISQIFPTLRLLTRRS
jgi:hypothetical protein